MKRILTGVVLVSAAMMPGVVARAQQTNAYQLCSATSGTPAEQRLASCTSVIEAGTETPENLARAFYNRGIVYFGKQDNDSAIADFDQAISLDPSIAVFFND